MHKIDFLTPIYICLFQPRQILTMPRASLGPEGSQGAKEGPGSEGHKFNRPLFYMGDGQKGHFPPIWTFHFHIVSYSNRFETAQNNLSRWFLSKYTFSFFYVWVMTQFEDIQNAIFGLQAILISLATFPYRCQKGSKGTGVLNPKKQMKCIFRASLDVRICWKKTYSILIFA